MTALYNEIDEYAAAWLRNLIANGLIAPGIVDTRSIVELQPSDVAGFTQVHFFAGIGVWSYALRRAGIPDNRPFWSASCPCQPFSDAGKGAGFDDERHLWPHLHWLIEQCRPDVIVGEQVASKDGLGWLDLVQADLEGSNYTSAAVDMCSAGFGAPHIRQRLYWMAYAARSGSGSGLCDSGQSRLGRDQSADGGATRIVGDTIGAGLEGYAGHGDHRDEPGWNDAATGRHVAASGSARGLAYPDSRDRGHVYLQRSGQHGQRPKDGSLVRSAAFGIGHNGGPELDRPGPTNGFWRDADWLLCRDGKWRPVEPGTFPLAHGAASRVGRLRAYGNAINAEQATYFCEAVKAYLDCAP